MSCLPFGFYFIAILGVCECFSLLTSVANSFDNSEFRLLCVLVFIKLVCSISNIIFCTKC
jgi:hypothetical protein